AGGHPHVQVRPGRLDARRDRWRAAMDAVHAVRLDVIGKPAGAANPGDKDELLLRHTQRRQDLLDLGQNRIIAATRTPADILVRRKVLGGQNRQTALTVHDAYLFSESWMIFSSTSAIRNGLP